MLIIILGDYHAYFCNFFCILLDNFLLWLVFKALNDRKLFLKYFNRDND